MLNYIWLALILLGFGAALFTAISNSSSDQFRKSIPFTSTIIFPEDVESITEGKHSAKIALDKKYFNTFYSESISLD